jgi:hypothetical protein
MDLNTFLEQLAATTASLQWDVTGVGLLRGQDADGGTYCPVTAVCAGEPDSLYEWDKAARAHGLPLNLGSQIVHAADIRRPPNPRLRAQLLAAVGLGLGKGAH